MNLIVDFKKYDTENDWTYGFSDDDLQELSEEAVKDNRYMSEYLANHGFTVYNTSTEREQILAQIVKDVKSNLV